MMRVVRRKAYSLVISLAAGWEAVALASLVDWQKVEDIRLLNDGAAL